MQEIHTKSLSLYRNLLRATSYFPDRFAQAIIHKHVVHRFKKARQRAIEASELESRRQSKGFKLILSSSASLATLKQRLSYGYQKLGALKRAVEGDANCFLKVLMIAYGRVGRRRRELIKILLTDDPGNIPEDTAALVEILNGNSNIEKLLESQNLKGGPKFNAFLKSQYACRIKDVRDTIKELEPKIPKENIWGRPLPLKRVATIKKNWWSMVLKKLLPPVTREEFQRLRSLSIDTTQHEWFMSKRKAAIPLNEKSVMKNSLQWLHIFKTPIRDLDEKEIDIIKCTPFGLVRDENEIISPSKFKRPPIQKFIRSHRSMRRLYGKVWALTPTMSKDEVTGIWNIEWGRGSSSYLAGRVTQPCNKDIELFLDIDNSSSQNS
ncbi:hypothetical protein OnM2_018067 [Erysiphe neolycopersici]|uniref:LYR motif-containing protein Cup1-like N-terminal domain-containing protein n=1 Tax=Erysiphe neolycopersici TaxID=212602 RepID=A0A420I4E3_9PEZI|nr:hypothetical protein OnM2_018067 [Erysiphe neolycopersici]